MPDFHLPLSQGLLAQKHLSHCQGSAVSHQSEFGSWQPIIYFQLKIHCQLQALHSSHGNRENHFYCKWLYHISAEINSVEIITQNELNCPAVLSYAGIGMFGLGSCCSEGIHIFFIVIRCWWLLRLCTKIKFYYFWFCTCQKHRNHFYNVVSLNIWSFEFKENIEKVWMKT